MRQAVNLQNTKFFGNKAMKGFTQLQGKVKILGRNLVRVTEYTSNLRGAKGWARGADRQELELVALSCNKTARAFSRSTTGQQSKGLEDCWYEAV